MITERNWGTQLPVLKATHVSKKMPIIFPDQSLKKNFSNMEQFMVTSGLPFSWTQSFL